MEKLCGIADCRMVMRQDRWCMGHLQLFLSAFWKSFLSTRRHPESLEASMTWFVFTCLAGLQASFFHTELWLSSWRVISILCLEYLICRSMKPSKNIWFYFTCSIPNTLQAPRDTDGCSYLWCASMYRVGEKPSSHSHIFNCLPTLKKQWFTVLNHIGLKYVGECCCEIPGTFVVGWIPQTCDFSWARLVFT